MSVDTINQASALDVLEQVLAAAGSPTLATRHRRNLGAAASWLQRLIDCGLLPDAPTAAAAAMEDTIVARLDAATETSSRSAGSQR